MKKLMTTALLLTAGFANAADITLSKSIKKDLREIIERDVRVLKGLQFNQEASAETLQILGLDRLDNNSANNWLNDRVSYVVEENAISLLKLLIKKVIYVDRSNATYPNAHAIPYAMNPKNKVPACTETFSCLQSEVNDNEKGMVVMANLGAALYMGGKDQKTVYGMTISRGLLKKGEKVRIDSPRAGIIQIGEGLFAKQLTINNQNPKSIANSINRLATFFHEARHSDGNGVSLAFAHSNCPTGHDYAGTAACDENLNGPYSVGAQMTLEMIKACGDSCTAREKEILLLTALESQSRILKTTYRGVPAVHWDASPESL